MSFIAAVVLYSNLTLSDAFHTFEMLCTSNRFLNGYHSDGFPSLKVDILVLRHLASEMFKKTMRHFDELGITLYEFAIEWLLCAFASSVSDLDTAVRIYDLVLLRGRHVLFQLTLGALKLVKRKLKKMHDLSTIIQTIRNVPETADTTHWINTSLKINLKESRVSELQSIFGGMM
eukprot:TRINITY_DN42236_c0_g1_i2.p1 TRINITY_DN42236_c0_g1~~TRINITY_DN42236_c0_g1_i2.p1  ORF type:complete len:175 (+),score=36.20 TRINITY_DN42236_c0_g1_i2:230-754(+)